MIKTDLQKILDKSGSVQRGLFRCAGDDGKMSMQARLGKSEDNLHCIIDGNVSVASLIDKQVSLIQKDKGDYLYISCRVTEETKRDEAFIVSLEILRACWFTRQMRGGVAWLKEKYIYNTEALAS